MTRRLPWRAVGIGAIVIALVVAARFLPLPEWLDTVRGRVEELGAWGAVLYGGVYLVASLLFMPGSLLTIAAGALFGVLWGTVVVVLAANAAAALAFLIARHLARGRVERMARESPKFEAIDSAVAEKGWQVVALMRLSPVIPFSLSNYLYGLTAVRFLPYVLASAVGMLPGTVLYVSLGAAGGAAAAGEGRRPAEWALLGAGLVATVVVTVVLTRSARRRLRTARVAE